MPVVTFFGLQVIFLFSGSVTIERIFAIPGAAITIYSRYADMVADPEVEAVIIASVNASHREQVLAAAAAGKQVVGEKPLGRTSGQHLRG